MKAWKSPCPECGRHAGGCCTVLVAPKLQWGAEK